MIRRILKYLSLSLAGLLVGLLLYFFAPALWNRWVTYPRLEKEMLAFQSRRMEPPTVTALKTYQGVLHAHSYWSHDSEGTLNRIIPAAKRSGVEFIFLTDHPHAGLDSFPRGYHGYFDGVLIEPGSEKHGYCAWPLKAGVIDWNAPRDSVIQRVVTEGGMFFYAHSEESHNWANAYYQGMEIYNIHTDTKDESLVSHIFNFMVNGEKFRHWALREIFDEHRDILALWDSLNMHRKIVGFSAVDAHENQNFRARMLADGRVEWLGPNADPIDTVELSFWNRWMFHPPDEEGWIFEFMIDTYETSFNHVTNYVMADTLSVPSLVKHIRQGNLFVAFKGLGDARGFMFYTRDTAGNLSGMPGDSVVSAQASSFNAVSPLPAKFRLLKNGRMIKESTVASYAFESPAIGEAGVYRLEARIEFDGEEVPWVYTNPIYIH